MTVIVTGGTGLVGKSLQKFCPNWIYLGSKDGDLTNMNETRQIFIKYQPSAIIHLAANVGGLYKNMDNNYQIFQDNMDINQNILKCCTEFNVHKGIFILSTCIFPDNIRYPINESMLHDGKPHDSNEGYSYAKRMMELMCRLHNKSYGSNFKCLIPTNLYGIHDNFHMKNSHVIPNLIHKCYLAKQHNLPFIIRGTGVAQRQFLYVDDFSKIIKNVFESDESFESLICTPSSEISIKELSEKIRDMFQLPYNQMIYDDTCSDGQIKKTACNLKLLTLFPDITFTDIDQGIRNVIQWVKETYPYIRQ